MCVGEREEGRGWVCQESREQLRGVLGFFLSSGYLVELSEDYEEKKNAEEEGVDVWKSLTKQRKKEKIKIR